METQKTVKLLIKRKEESERMTREEERRREEETDRQRKRRSEEEQKRREQEEEQRRVDEEWRRVEKMRVKEERRVEREWRCQERWRRKREENRKRVMEERKCFGRGGFGHMAHNCRDKGKKGPAWVPSNRFEVLKVRIMQRGEGSSKEVAKNRREILREEKAKRGEEVRQAKIEKKEKREKTLREVVVKIGLKQEGKEEGVVTEALLDNGATELVMSEEFVRRHKFKRTKLERPVYVRNMDGTLNYVGPIVDTVEVEIFFKGHKERMSIDVIGGQKWSVILGMPWLGRHNPEIDWKIGEVKMTRCPDECGKKWRVGKQTKPG